MRQVVLIGLVLATFLIAVSAVFWRSTENSRHIPARTASPYLPVTPVKTAGPVEQTDGRVVTEVAPEPAKSSAVHTAAPASGNLPRLPDAPQEPKWRIAFQDAFSDAEAAKRVFPLGGGKVSYFEPKPALLLRSGDGGEVFAALHKSLPGDLRVRFKALRSKAADQVSIGLFFSIAGDPGKMDGYFAEWARGTVQLKREHQVLKSVDFPTPQTRDRWVNLELRRVGGTITLLMEGKEALTYTDAQPLADSDHDVCAFYVWSDQTLVRDVVIERNDSDPIQPLDTDPATKSNLIDGSRGGKRPADF